MADRAFQAEHRHSLAEYSICRKRLKQLEQNCSLMRLSGIPPSLGRWFCGNDDDGAGGRVRFRRSGGGNGNDATTTTRLECGKPSTPPNKGNNSRIINGEEAIPHSFPWMASIEGDISDQHYCGASIISPQWAVTAGHCGEIIFIGEYSGDEIALGLHDRREQEGGRQNSRIEEVFIHPDYDEPERANDIALIKMMDSAEFNDVVSPICLPNQDDFGDGSSFGVGMNCYLSGWGVAGDDESLPSDFVGQPWALRQAVLPLVADQDCQDIYLEEANFQIQPTMQCAGGEGSTSCNGDSGGPLVCEVDGTWYQVGIVSFGPSPCDTVYPAVYTRVAGYSNWIMETIEANGGF